MEGVGFSSRTEEEPVVDTGEPAGIDEVSDMIYV